MSEITSASGVRRHILSSSVVTSVPEYRAPDDTASVDRMFGTDYGREGRCQASHREREPARTRECRAAPRVPHVKVVGRRPFRHLMRAVRPSWGGARRIFRQPVGATHRASAGLRSARKDLGRRSALYI